MAHRSANMSGAIGLQPPPGNKQQLKEIWIEEEKVEPIREILIEFVNHIRENI